jgi:tetratricopeptide (TPR) repeat protein
MQKRYMLMVVLMLGIGAGCSGKADQEQEAQRQVLSVRDLEEELETLPQAISRYSEIAQKYSGTPAAEKAKQRKEKLDQVQELLSKNQHLPSDQLQEVYESALSLAPDYLAVLKKLGTIYFNQTHLAALGAVNTGIIEMQEGVIETWNKQSKIWSAYEFRAIPDDRLWQDRLCKQAIDVTKMLIDQRYREYEKGLRVIQEGLAFAAGEDVKAQAKVYAAYCTFWKGKKEDFEKGIAFAQEALAYDFLPDEDKARAYHVTGLCYTYLYQDTKKMADLDAAIKALNECVNIDNDMAEAKDLLKGLRQQRDRMNNAS